MDTNLILLPSSIVICFMFSIFRKKYYNFTLPQITILSFLLIFNGVIGAKLLYTLEASKISFSGQSFFGALFFVPFGLFITSKLMKIDFGKCLDYFGSYVPLVLAILRIGCAYNGCCGAKLIEINGILYNPPIQIIELVCDIIIFLTLLYLERKSQIIVCGEQYPKFMISYGFVRLVMENYRDTPKNIFGMSNGQWLSIVSALFGITILYCLRTKNQCKENNI